MAADFHAYSSATEKQGFFGKVGGEVEDFGAGLYHSAVETPVNGVVQVINHTANSSLPEVHLVNESNADATFGRKAGDIAGSAIDLIGLSLAAGGFGGRGLVASGLRMGGVGAIYAGIFQPTNTNSQTFWQDRLGNAAVSGTTFGAMGLGAAALDASFAVPAGRTLLQNIAYNGAAGAIGGVAHAEANAMVKQGRVLPKFSDFVSDVSQYGAFGAALGATDFALNRILRPSETLSNTADNSVKVWSDSSGNPARVEGKLNLDSKYDAYTKAYRLSDGTWSVKAVNGWDSDVTPTFTSVARNTDGSVSFASSTADRLATFSKDGSLTIAHPQLDELTAKLNAANAAGVELRLADTGGQRLYDSSGNMTELKAATSSATSEANDLSQARFDYDTAGGKLKKVSFTDTSGNTVAMSPRTPHFWNITKNDEPLEYNWFGEVKAPSISNGSTIEVTPLAGGKMQFTTADSKAFVDTLGRQAEFESSGNGNAILRVTDEGDYTLTTGTNAGQKVVLGDKTLPPNLTVSVEPGDSVSILTDRGGGKFQSQKLNWGRTAEGTPTLGDSALTPRLEHSLSF